MREQEKAELDADIARIEAKIVDLEKQYADFKEWRASVEAKGGTLYCDDGEYTDISIRYWRRILTRRKLNRYGYSSDRITTS